MVRRDNSDKNGDVRFARSRATIQNRDLIDFKRRYLALQRAVRQTQLVATVAGYTFRNFPRNLPQPLSSAVKTLFRQASSALTAAVSNLESQSHERERQSQSQQLQTPWSAKINVPKRGPHASAVALDSLLLFAAADFDKRKKALPFEEVGTQFQILVRHQAVAMMFAHFDAFMADAIRVVCKARPEVLRSGKQLTWETALEFEDREALVNGLVEQFTYEFGWKTLSDRFDHFRDRLGVDTSFFSEDQRKLVSLFEQRRHLIVHNGGIVSRRYVRETRDHRAKVGHPVPVSHKDVRLVGDAVSLLSSELFSAVAVKFLDAKGSDLTQVWQRSPAG